jgi:hypothetical protein
MLLSWRFEVEQCTDGGEIAAFAAAVGCRNGGKSLLGVVCCMPGHLAGRPT